MGALLTPIILKFSRRLGEPAPPPVDQDFAVCPLDLKVCEIQHLTNAQILPSHRCMGLTWRKCPRKGSKINGLTIGKVNKVGVEEIIYREEQHLRRYYRILAM